MSKIVSDVAMLIVSIACFLFSVNVVIQGYEIRQLQEQVKKLEAANEK